ncbi:MAG: hypothetical protein OZ919_01865 [Xanthomonadaceae bacterium]|nr:hypothetical protein [Xanthomonadaceae bacterium]
MPSAWRQGDLIHPDDAVALALLEAHQRDTHRALVISHSCDLSASEDFEPEVEVLIGEVLPGASNNKKLHNGHSIRQLHLFAPDGESEEWVKFLVRMRRTVCKTVLASYRPWSDRSYCDRQRRVLARWLAQRYSRSAFPDAFNLWLWERNVTDRLEKLVRQHSDELVAVYFDLDEGADLERDDPDQPYELGIELVYATSNANYAANAERLAEQIRDLFEARCKTQDCWRWIELVYCAAIADTAFTLHDANRLRRWRLEHYSAAGEPLDESE